MLDFVAGALYSVDTVAGFGIGNIAAFVGVGIACFELDIVCTVGWIVDIVVWPEVDIGRFVGAVLLERIVDIEIVHIDAGT